MFMAVQNISSRVNLSNIAHKAAEIAVSFGYQVEFKTHLKQFGLKKSLVGLESHEVGFYGILIPKSGGVDVTSLYLEQDPHTYRTLLEEGYL